jgi:DNA (cytosine-5)-methyltransferase 1
MVGNAVSVSVSRWLGERLAQPSNPLKLEETPFQETPWPRAAWGRNGERYAVAISSWPLDERYNSLEDFLLFDTRPLSERATSGFLSRVARSSLRFPPGFVDDVRAHASTFR